MVIVISITLSLVDQPEPLTSSGNIPGHLILLIQYGCLVGSQGDANYRGSDCYYSDGTDPVLCWLCTIVFKVPLNTGQFSQGRN